MTPAVNAAKKAGISFQLHQYKHDPAAASYGLEAAEMLEIDAERVFKTLLVCLDGRPKSLGVAIVPVTAQLNLKAAATALGAKKAAMADVQIVQSTTGYLVGGISPIGQKKSLPTLIDSSVAEFGTILVSAGRRGLEIELSPEDLLEICSAKAINALAMY